MCKTSDINYFFGFCAAASKSLWKEFVLINEDESEYDTEMSETDEVAQPMVVSKREVDEQMKSVMKDFEVQKLLCLHLFLTI